MKASKKAVMQFMQYLEESIKERNTKKRHCIICNHLTGEKHSGQPVCGYHESHSLACREVYEERIIQGRKPFVWDAEDPYHAEEFPEKYRNERDVYEDYKSYIASNEWQIKAYYAKRKAGYKCQDCGARGSVGTLDAHHVTYDRLFKEWRDDLAILCRACHGKRHGK